MTAPTVIRCIGRPVDRSLTVAGQECGRIYTGPKNVCEGVGDDGWGILRPPTAAEVQQRARAAGWRIGTLTDGTTVASCPACSRPAPGVVALCRELERQVRP